MLFLVQELGSGGKTKPMFRPVAQRAVASPMAGHTIPSGEALRGLAGWLFGHLSVAGAVWRCAGGRAGHAGPPGPWRPSCRWVFRCCR